MTVPLKKYQRKTLDALAPHPRNARQGDIGSIVESLKTHGQYKPIVVQRSTGFILAGNHTFMAARTLGWKDIEVAYVDVDDDEALRILLVDNRTSDLAVYDDQALADLLTELAATSTSFEGTGFDGDDLDQLLADLAADPPPLKVDPDEVPDAPTKPVAKLGDLYEMGEHRVLCGDATKPESYARVMGSDLADCVWTDPPYGVDYVAKTTKALKIQGDDQEGLHSMLVAAFTNVEASMKPGTPFYCSAPAGPNNLEFALALREVGFRVHEELVWVKNAMVLGHSDYHYRHEPIFYGWSKGAGRSGRGSQRGTKWYGDNSQTSVLEFDKPSRSEHHPTMKPVGLVERCIENSSRPGGIVLDPFGGSGSTLIACEQSGRKCRMIELDPRYVDVIVQRWQNATGKKAKRVR